MIQPANTVRVNTTLDAFQPERFEEHSHPIARRGLTEGHPDCGENCNSCSQIETFVKPVDRFLVDEEDIRDFYQRFPNEKVVDQAEQRQRRAFFQIAHIIQSGFDNIYLIPVRHPKSMAIPFKK